MELEGLNATRAKQTKRLPVVFTQEEVKKLLAGVKGDAGLAVKLLYGCGLRVAEVLALRVKDVDVGGGKIDVRGGSRGDWRVPRQTEQSEARRGPEPRGGSGINGDKDRVITLPKSLLEPIRVHLVQVKAVFDADGRDGVPGVAMPKAYDVKGGNVRHYSSRCEGESSAAL